MKTIAVFSAYYYPHLGGIERYIDNMMHQLIKKNYNVILVTSNFDNLKDYEIIDNIKIYRLPVFKLFKNRYPIFKHNKKYKKLMNDFAKNKIDRIIVNTRFHLTSHIGARYGKKNNIPVYLIEHGSQYITVNNKFWDFFANEYERFLTYKIKNKIKGFYGVSKACSDWLVEFNIKASGVWYNSIDIHQKLPKRKKHDSIIFLYAGRLIKQKGVENILISFQNLTKKYDNIKLYIAGDGEEFNYYKNLYKNKNIVYLGKLNYLELLNYYALTDIFLYPPLWPEGLPTSILEAGLMKCSVIGTKQGGIKEVLNKNNGLLVDNTQKSLEIGMEKLYKDKKLRDKLRNNLYNDILNNFSWDVTINQIIKDIDI